MARGPSAGFHHPSSYYRPFAPMSLQHLSLTLLATPGITFILLSLLWLLGVPIPVIILLWFFMR